MLRAPDGLPAIHRNLAFQDAVNAPFNGCCHALARPVVHKGKLRSALHNIAKQGHHANHGIVIERDVCGVAPGIGIVLRPAAIVVLGRQKKANPGNRCQPVSIILELAIGLGQVSDLIPRGAVVNRGIALVLLAQQSLLLSVAEFVFPFEILGPTSVCSLIQEESFCDVVTASIIRCWAGHCSRAQTAEIRLQVCIAVGVLVTVPVFWIFRVEPPGLLPVIGHAVLVRIPVVRATDRGVRVPTSHIILRIDDSARVFDNRLDESFIHGVTYQGTAAVLEA